MSRFLLIYKGKTELDYSQKELDKRLEEYNTWVEQLGERHIDANRLQQSGIHLKGKNTYVTDGPFLEAKEIIAGYTIIEADDLDAALIDAKNCPLVKYFEIFLRPMV